MNQNKMIKYWQKRLNTIVGLLLLLIGIQGFAQENYTVSGKISDIDNGETLLELRSF